MDQQDEKRARTPRYFLTSAQLETTEGLELLQLLQTVTQDGTISDEEIRALREWLDINYSADLPAIALLTDRVEKILADGKVTEEEREAIYSDIETILPPDIRRDVTAKRSSLDREKRLPEREMTGETRGKNAPVARFDFMVAGVKYEGNPGVVRYYARQGDDVLLVRDRGSKKSPNTVEIHLQNRMQIGYVPEEDAREIASFLDQGYKYRALIKNMLTGGRTPIPVVKVHIYSPRADLEELRFGGNVAESKSSRSIVKGYGYGLAVVTIAAVLLILLRFSMC